MEKSSNRLFEYVIKYNDSDLQLSKFLAKRFTYLSEEKWKSEIKEKRIHLNYEETSPEVFIRQGDRLQYYPQNFIEPDVDKNFKVIYESDDIVVIDKPGNLPVHPSGIYKENTLLTILSKINPNKKFYPVHRLDRETSGIQIFALTQNIASKIQKLFESRKVTKEYIVYVHGNFLNDLVIEGFLSSEHNSQIRKKRKFNFFEGDEFCSTTFKLITVSKNISKIMAIPNTGRSHQIRATLCSLGFPIIADKLYGKDELNFLKFIDGYQFKEYGINRQALHASRIIIEISGNILEFISPEPDDLLNIFTLNEK